MQRPQRGHAVALDADEEVDAEIAVPARVLQHRGAATHRFVAESGAFVVEAGRSAGDRRLSAELRSNAHAATLGRGVPGRLVGGPSSTPERPVPASLLRPAARRPRGR
jgi:hypothetical protein